MSIDLKLLFSLSLIMLRFESLGPTLIDCEGCSNYISVYIANRDDAANNNNDVKGKKIKKMTIIDRYIPMAQKIKDMQVYDDDIWVMSFPKVYENAVYFKIFAITTLNFAVWNDMDTGDGLVDQQQSGL